MARVLAVTKWRTNGAMIATCAQLGLLRPQDRVLDPTYEGGLWWSDFRPIELVALNRDIDGSDFRKLDYPDASFDAVAYDPPYVCAGGRETTTVPEFHQRYGMEDAPRTPAGVQQQINDGLTEMWRLLKPSAVRTLDPLRPNGVCIVKTQNYISGGKLQPSVFDTYNHALGLGFTLWDQFEHLSGSRPQPLTNRDGSPRRQVHAHRNHSTTLVLRKPPAPKQRKPKP